ncbi:hypothetical protein DPQ33_10865 [Oceanidesulfovibrio indonesiensis]|uniref:Uncharacterized protein n=1 Tax=Oceanidesulfovibrio indonesiensis TaxID=54767 RepID=A0A7M3MDV8_9BACT|nr:hypothetical protein [Oceanidesulfovibrio indonesiensis]TVM16901.1 hypothetical protein DPQ33_10865 [Oceanidesulfovibrio indonesiensis]
MRLLGVVLVWAAILCALGLFLMGRDRPARTVAPAAVESGSGSAFDSAGYTLEITPSFAPAPDSFALPGDPLARSGLVVSRNGHILYTYENGGEQGATIELHPAPGIEPGLVEYLVEASAVQDANGSPQSAALRVRLLHYGGTLAEKTFWSDPGGLIRGVLRVSIETPEGMDHGG